jgi:glutamate:Na+ symporter, ESS family
MSTAVSTANVPVWKIGPVLVLALGCAGVLLGDWLKRRAAILNRLDIPGPIAGGMVFALATFFLHDRWVNLEADTVLRDLFMVAFMTTVGLSASLQLIRASSWKILSLLALASFGAILQNALGMGIAHAMGLDARLGIMVGSAALAGGPATALSFGVTFEKLGVRGATALGMAAATFGIAVAGLIGGYIGGWLIRRGKLSAATGAPKAAAGATPATLPPTVPSVSPQVHAGSLLHMVLVTGIAMGLGNLLSAQFERRGLILPSYIGALMIAAAIRNLDDHFHFARIAQPEVDAIARIVLPLFIVLALITLRLWELASLALPAIVILAAEVALCWLMCVTIVYWGMARGGSKYESAVTSSGFCGFMLGITANAIACMEELVEKYGPAPEAFLVVPLVGAFLIDLTNSLIITAMANLVR